MTRCLLAFVLTLLPFVAGYAVGFRRGLRWKSKTSVGQEAQDGSI